MAVSSGAVAGVRGRASMTGAMIGAVGLPTGATTSASGIWVVMICTRPFVAGAAENR